MKLEYRNELIEKLLRELGIDSENEDKRLMYGKFLNTLDCEEVDISHLVLQFQFLWNEAFAAGYLAAHEPENK